MRFSSRKVILISSLIVSTSTGTIIRVPQDQLTIQAGINVAADGDTVLVDTGRYVENINFNGKNIVLGSWFLVTGDTSFISQTIIDGDSSGSVVTFENGEDSTTVLTGFTITNGNGSGGPDYYGGGITCKNFSSPSLSYLSVIGNTNWDNGGGILCWSSSPTLNNVTIKGNTSSEGGGIDFHYSSSPRLSNVVISRNTAFHGGGVLCWSTNPRFENVVIEGNISTEGGGLLFGESNPKFKNVTVIGNTSEYDGGGIFCEHNSTVSLTSVTVSGNKANLDGGGIYLTNNSTVFAMNTILWNNFPEEIYFNELTNPNSVVVVHSDVQGGEAGIVTNDNGTVNWLEGNINTKPLFVDPENGDFHLNEGSPCVDAGMALFVWQGDTLVNLPPTAYEGNAPDMGAYESPYTAGIDQQEMLPNRYSFHQNYPNPFNPTTTFQYDLPRNGNVSLTIYDLLGREVEVAVDSWQVAGTHSVVWDAAGVPSGIYLVRMVSGEFSQVRKVMVLR